MYDAIIRGQNRSAEGYPRLDLSESQRFELRVRIYNSWDFPVSIQATAEVGDNWDSYIDGVPNGHVYIDPGKAQEFSGEIAGAQRDLWQLHGPESTWSPPASR